MEVSRYDDISQVMGVPQKSSKWLLLVNGKTNGLGQPYFRTPPHIYICIHIYIYIWAWDIFWVQAVQGGIITSKNWGYIWVSQHPMIHEVQHWDGYDWGNPPKNGAILNTCHMWVLMMDGVTFLRVIFWCFTAWRWTSPDLTLLWATWMFCMFRLGQGCATHCSHVSGCLAARLWYIFLWGMNGSKYRVLQIGYPLVIFT